MRSCISGVCFGLDHSLDADILLAAVNRFAYLDILAAKLSRYLEQPDFDIRDLKRLFLRTQPGALDGLTGATLTEAGRPALLEQAEALFKDARRIGADIVIVRPKPADVGRTEAQESLAALAALGERWSVRPAFAPAPGSGPLASYKGLGQLLSDLYGGRAGMLLDTVLVAREGGPALVETLAQAGHVTHVHVADASEDGSGPRRLPGQGALPLASMLRVLADAGYDRIVSVATDVAGTELDPAAMAREAREALTSLFAQAGVDESGAAGAAPTS